MLGGGVKLLVSHLGYLVFCVKNRINAEHRFALGSKDSLHLREAKVLDGLHYSSYLVLCNLIDWFVLVGSLWGPGNTNFREQSKNSRAT